MTNPLSRDALRIAAGGSLLLGSAAGLALVDAAFGAAPAGAGPIPDPGATIIVDTLADGPGDSGDCVPSDPVVGDCSLRDAIELSNQIGTPGSAANTVVFDPGLAGTITLSSSLPLLTGSITIEGNTTTDFSGYWHGPAPTPADIASGRGVRTKPLITVEGSRTYAGFVQDPTIDPVTHQPTPIDLTITGLDLHGLSAIQSFGGSLDATAINVVAGSIHVADTIVSGSGARTGSSSYFAIAPITVGSVVNLGDDWGLETSATFDHVHVVDNESVINPLYGTAGSIVAVGNDISFTNSIVADNSADQAAGPFLGAIASTTVDNVRITGNTARGSMAGLGAVGTTTRVSNAIISGNHAATAAAMFSYGGLITGTPGTFDVSDTLISDNTQTYGALMEFTFSQFSLDRVSIVDNVTAAPIAPGSVDGLAPQSNDLQNTVLRLDADTTIRSSTIADNVGGAIAVGDAPIITGTTATQSLDGDPSGGTGILGRLFHRTNSSRPVGALSIATRPAYVHVLHSTIAGNPGGGVIEANNRVDHVSADDVHLDHVVLAHNSGTNDIEGVPTLVGDLAVPSIARYSLIQVADVAPIEGLGVQIGADPQLGALECPSPYVCVLPVPTESPAWNAGDPAFAPPPDTDQRGLPRVVDIIDLGAYELQYDAVPAFTG